MLEKLMFAGVDTVHAWPPDALRSGEPQAYYEHRVQPPTSDDLLAAGYQAQAADEAGERQAHRWIEAHLLGR